MGITQKTWDAWRATHVRLSGLPLIATDVYQITQEDAKAVYHENYWLAAGCASMAWPMSLFVFDAAVNCGVGRATDWYRHSIFPKDMLVQRANFYHGLVATHPKLQKFLKGWLKRCDALAAYL